MALSASTPTPLTITTFLLFLLFPTAYCYEVDIYWGSSSVSVPESDVDLLEFPLNLEFLEAEFFLYGSLGYGLDKFAPNLSSGGPPPIGARRAKLDTFTRDVIKQFALQEVGHLRLYIYAYLLSFKSLFSFHCTYIRELKCFFVQSDSKGSKRISEAIVGFKCSIVCKSGG
jgi:hypothetical protein